MATEYRFNWHEQRRDSWEQWWLLHVISESRSRGGPDEFDKWKALTDSGADCRITVQLNGEEVDAKAFFDRMFDALESESKREANRIVSRIPGFDDLAETLDDVQRHLKYELRSKLRGMGIETYDEDD